MTQIYADGTVSIANGDSAVTGAGTAWAVALVKGGMFSCAGLAVPIASVDSDTSLTLAYDWPGTTAAGAAYAIALENADAANIVDLNRTLARILTTLSLAGIHPNASGTLTERDAIDLSTDDEGFIFLRAEIGIDLALYRWTGTAWDGPFALRGFAGVGAGGYGLPAGGAAGQLLRKASGTDGDTGWSAATLDGSGNLAGIANLTAAGLIDISGAAAGRIKFPASQNPSADPNTFDDYEEGTWTPVLTFAAPGDLAIVYSSQAGTYTKKGREITLSFDVVTTTFTYTTATGGIQITGAPFSNSAAGIRFGSLSWGGINKAGGYTQVNPRIGPSMSIINFQGAGMGVAQTTITQPDVPSGGTVFLRGTMLFEV